MRVYFLFYKDELDMSGLSGLILLKVLYIMNISPGGGGWWWLETNDSMSCTKHPNNLH